MPHRAHASVRPLPGDSMKSTRPTSRDIARLAEVSQATVSRALRNSPLVRPETRERMFETYFSTKGTQGRGLGMSIVNQIVTMAGGFIQVDSYLGRGTRVRLYLPRIAGIE